MAQNDELQHVSADIDKLWYGDGGLETVGLDSKARTLVDKFNGPRKAVNWEDGDWGGVDQSYKKSKISADDFSEADLAELARRDPAFRKKWDAAQMEEVTLAFVRGEPKYLSTDRNFKRMVKHLGKTYLDVPNLDSDDGIEKLYEADAWKVENLNAAFNTLSRAGQLEVEYGTFRELTKAEKLAVISDVRMGALDDAINRFVAFSFDGNPPQIGRGRDFAAANPELFSKAVWFIWAELHAGEIMLDELTAFRGHMRQHVLPTLPLLEKAYTSWRESEPLRRASLAAEQSKDSQTIPPQLTRKEIEAMSAEEIDRRIKNEAKRGMRARYD